MKEYNDWHIKLMHIIKVNGNLESLLYEEHNFNEIIRSIHNMISDGLITCSDSNYILTADGDMFFKKHSRPKGLYRYLYEDWQFVREPLPIDAIYIPRKRKGKEV